MIPDYQQRETDAPDLEPGHEKRDTMIILLFMAFFFAAIVGLLVFFPPA
jgi:hypothetical protein